MRGKKDRTRHGIFSLDDDDARKSQAAMLCARRARQTGLISYRQRSGQSHRRHPYLISDRQLLSLYLSFHSVSATEPRVNVLLEHLKLS